MQKSTIFISAFITLIILFAGHPSNSKTIINKKISKDTLTKQTVKMKIEIWSDVVCPFCYIGKTKFDKALNDFKEKNNIEIEWKSFQLMPEISTQTKKRIDQVLAESKGISLDQAKQMSAHATLIGKQAGLEFNYDKAIVANTFKAHQFLHFAKLKGKQHEAEELMFKSHFTEGKNVDDIETLIDLGSSIGLDANELKQALVSNAFANDVKLDIKKANEIGVRGVPFFLFNGKYAVSGAQEPALFLKALEKSYAEWTSNNPNVNSIEVKEGASCTPDSKCE